MNNLLVALSYELTCFSKLRESFLSTPTTIPIKQVNKHNSQTLEYGDGKIISMLYLLNFNRMLLYQRHVPISRNLLVVQVMFIVYKGNLLASKKMNQLSMLMEIWEFGWLLQCQEVPGSNHPLGEVHQPTLKGSLGEPKIYLN